MQAVHEMYKDGEISSEASMTSLGKHMAEMAKAFKTDKAEISKPVEKVKKRKNAKASSDDSDSGTGSGSDKPKRKANDFVIFSSCVRKILKEREESIKDVGTHNQFCSHLKGIKSYTEWIEAFKEDEKVFTDEEADAIISAKADWVKPEISKQEADGKSKGKGSRRSSVVSAEVKEEEKEEKKPEKKEEKKAEIKKPEEKKAEIKKEIKKPEIKKEVKEEKKKPGRPPKKVEEKKKAEEKKADESDDLDFEGFEHDGTLYLKSAQGYMLSTDIEWVGIWDGESIDTDAAEPECVAEYRKNQ